MKNRIKNVLKDLGVFSFSRKLYHQVAKLLFGHRKYWKLKTTDKTILFSTADTYSNHWFYPRYAFGKTHEPLATELLQQILKPSSVFLDVGAHLGYFSCLGAALCKDGEVHAFEIDPLSVERLMANADLNDFKNLKVVSMAVTNEKGVVRIPKRVEPNPGLGINQKAKDYIEVPSTDLDSYVVENQISPDFIKIDVEGAEALVLGGMKEILEEGKVQILIEIHPNLLQSNFNSSTAAVLGVLENYGYTFKSMEHRESQGNQELISSDYHFLRNSMIYAFKE